MTDRQVLELMAALGSPSRLRLLRRLLRKELRCSDAAGCDLSARCCTVSELAVGSGMSLATASHHLKELRRAGLIVTQRRGRQVYCAINGRSLRALAEVIESLVPDAPLRTASTG